MCTSVSPTHALTGLFWWGLALSGVSCCHQHAIRDLQHIYVHSFNDKYRICPCKQTLRNRSLDHGLGRSSESQGFIFRPGFS